MKDQLEQIEKYLNGEFSQEEKERFEKRIMEEDELRKLVDEHRILLRGLELGFNRELKSRLQLEEQRFTKNERKSKRRILPLRWSIGIAATMAILIVTVLLLNYKPVNTQELFIAYYQPYPNVEQPLSRSDVSASSAYVFYEKGLYQPALKSFESLVKENPEDPAALFYMGICRLELGETDQAIFQFQSVRTLESNKYSRSALWYEALSHLKNDQKSKAIELFETLSGGNDAYANQSRELIAGLR